MLESGLIAFPQRAGADKRHLLGIVLQGIDKLGAEQSAEAGKKLRVLQET